MFTCGHGGVPDEGHRVPEHEGGVDPGLGGVHVVCPVLALAHLYLHELSGYVSFVCTSFLSPIFLTLGMLSAKEIAVTGMM